MKLIEFTAHNGQATLVDPEEIAAVRQSGGPYEGSAIIVLKDTSKTSSRCLEIFVKESSNEVRDKLANHQAAAEAKPIRVLYIEASQPTYLSGPVSQHLAAGWSLNGDVQALEKPLSDSEKRAFGMVPRLYVQALVRCGATENLDVEGISEAIPHT